MILGFISLLMTFGQKYITQICIPVKLADTMLPCPLKSENAAAEGKGEHSTDGGGENHRRLLSQMIMDLAPSRRALTAGAPGVSCPAVSN